MRIGDHGREKESAGEPGISADVYPLLREFFSVLVITRFLLQAKCIVGLLRII
jgi:hypothetical protein